MSEFTTFAPGTDDDSGAATAEYAIATIVEVYSSTIDSHPSAGQEKP